MQQNILFTLFLCLAFLSNTGIHAQNPLSFNTSEYSDYTDDLLCRYEKEINLPKKQIIAFLNAVASQNNSSCSSPTPNSLPHAAQELAYEWPSLPCAKQYRVGYLSLMSGSQNIRQTQSTSIHLSNLDSELHLFAIASEDASGGGSDLTIIITDVKVSLIDEETQNCVCKGSISSLEEANSDECDINTAIAINRTSFSWANTCPFNKYKFIVEGNINEQSFTYEYWFTIGASAIIQHPHCSASTPFNIPEDSNHPAWVEAAVSVEMDEEGVTFSLASDYKGSMEVQGFICDCIEISINSGNYIKLPSKTTPPFNVFPNPFDSGFTVNIQTDKTQDLIVRLLDSNGRSVLEQRPYLEKGAHQLYLLTDHLTQGLYYIQVNTDQDTYLEKIIKL